MKIVYCLNSIRYLGGIQRVTIVKANALAEIEDNEVFLIVTDNDRKALITTPLSDKVTLIDLQINYYEDDWKSRWNVWKGIFKKRLEHKRKLSIVLNRIQPDVVISVGQSEKYMLLEIPGQWKKIREMHYTKDYRQRLSNSLLEKLSSYISDYYDYRIKINQYDQIVLLTEEDKNNNWKGYKNTIVIPNPITIEANKVSTLNSKTVITSGRLEKQKNFISLIRAFKKVLSSHPDWTLEIYGEGSQRRELEEYIISSGLSTNVFLKGYTADIQNKMLSSSIFVMSSIFEGFGLVLIEAMEMGLPVISYACPCGPKDIITEGKDGFLIPMNDEDILASKINSLIENDSKRKEMGKEAKRKAETYQIENIIPLWMKLFKK